jgi:TRAP-type C4-dicarboxylate transport system substrate-binding protein
MAEYNKESIKKYELEKRIKLFKQGMKIPTMKAISEKGKARQSVSDNFHKSMKKYGYDGGKKAEALEKAKK